MTTIPARPVADGSARQASNAARVLARLRRQPATVVAFVFLVLLVVMAVFAPLLAPHDPTVADFDNVLQGPSSTYLLGTDDLGHDVLSQLIYGSRVVLLVACGSILVAILIGVPVGLLFGYHGGWWDRLGMRVVDMAQALPGMLIGLTVIAILGRYMVVLMVAIGLIFASSFARMTRATVLGERRKLYVEAAEVSGLSHSQIIFGQVLPNLIGPIVTQGAVFLGSAIMIESAMSFLGIGLDGDTATWGAMLSLAVEKKNVAPYLAWPPGIAIVLTVLAFNVLGDGLNDALTGERRRVPRTPSARTAGTAATARSTTTTAAKARSAVDADRQVLVASGVRVELAHPTGDATTLVQGVDLEVARGEIVGLLGESGSGKSTFARAVLGMLPPGLWLADGSIAVAGTEVAGAGPRDLQRLRGGVMAAVFQDPATALSPVHTVGTQLVEPLRIHHALKRQAARARAVELLERVGVRDAARRLDDYPHQFSGGMAQRVAIAMALAGDPELLIADEATSALDVTTQSQVLDLILDLRDEYGMGVLMITHSLGVIAETCDRAAVMYKGRLVEDAPVERLFAAPQHPYTAALLAANPLNADTGGRLPTIDAATREAIDAALEPQEVSA